MSKPTLPEVIDVLEAKAQHGLSFADAEQAAADAYAAGVEQAARWFDDQAARTRALAEETGGLDALGRAMVRTYELSAELVRETFAEERQAEEESAR